MNHNKFRTGCLIFFLLFSLALYGGYRYLRPKVEARVLQARMEDQGTLLGIYYFQSSDADKERYRHEGLQPLMATITKERDLRIPFQPWKENDGPGDARIYCDTVVNGKVLIVRKDQQSWEWIDQAKLYDALNTPAGPAKP
jgi:hypothetical protein